MPELCSTCGRKPVLRLVRCCWSCRRQAVIVRVYRRTASLAKAAAAAGCSQSYAWQIANRAQLIQNRTPSYPTALIQEAARLYVDERLSCRGVEVRLKQRHAAVPSQQTIYLWLKHQGVLRTKSAADRIQNGRRNGIDYDDVASRARELAGERRWSVRRIALELGVSRNAVRAYLDPQDRCGAAEATVRAAWLADTPEAAERRQKREKVLALRRQGASYPEIEQATGLSTATVYLYLLAAGLVAREEYPEELRGLIRHLATFRRAIRSREKERG